MNANVMADAVPAAGHNSGEELPLEERLKRDYAGILDDLKTWTERAGRAPTKIELVDPKADETLVGIGRVVVKLKDVISRAKEAHAKEKAPYLAAATSIDMFFLTRGIQGICDAVIKKLEAVQRTYTIAKEASLRARAEAEERERREEAERALELARHAEDHGEVREASQLLGEAAKLETQANDAAQVATASTADLVRTTSPSQGVTVTARKEWTFEVEAWGEIDLNQLRAQFAQADIEKAVRAFVKLGGRQLKGVRIFETQKVTNRG